jgi:transcriptional regulator with XRE-family HTH domain
MEGELKTRYTHAAYYGARMRAFRKSLGMSLKEVAGKANLSYQYLASVEKGEVNTPIETLAKIAEALNTSLDVIIAGKRSATYAATLRALADELDQLAAVS